MTAPLQFGDEVRAALADGQPVVALETTILTHGMPYPQNLETALAVEDLIRKQQAVPATIAIHGGQICVGLDADELERLAKAESVLKLSRADLSYALASGRDGATTVAATMICAKLAGIAVFATGGIGGVHRGAEQSMDISADLEELSRTPVAVVCAGAKALLDIPKTLEVLETRGVPVIGYGVDDFPAFWSRSSRQPAPLRIDTASELARFIRTQAAIGFTCGTLVANPIPVADEIPADEMNAAIDRAISDAARAQIHGKAVTPWLLDRIYTITAGRSLVANIALVMNNARLASELACELKKKL